jgi:hypothetical protein
LPSAPCAGFPAELLSRSAPIEVSTPSPVLTGDRQVSFENVPSNLMSFGFSIVGRFVQFELDDLISESIADFKYFEFEGTTKMEPTVTEGSSVEVPIFGAFEYCELRSSRGSKHCHEIPGDQVIVHRTCQSDRAMMILTPR